MRTVLAILSLSVLPALAAAGDGTPAASGDKSAKAKQEKERPKPAPPKVYTDEDLKTAREKSSGNVTVLGDPDAPPAAPADAEQKGSDTPLSAPTSEAGWRGQARQRWGAIRTAERRIQELEALLQELELDRNPNPADLLDASRLQKREAAKADTRDQIEATRSQLTSAQQALEDLQEKARNAGVPQSWVEEPQPEPEPQR